MFELTRRYMGRYLEDCDAAKSYAGGPTLPGTTRSKPVSRHSWTITRSACYARVMAVMSFALVCAAAPLRAQETDSTAVQQADSADQRVDPTVQREHEVRDGDTLWDLANFYLEDPYLWPVIYQANPDVVEDPHWIYPKELLIIPGVRPDATQVAENRPEDAPDTDTGPGPIRPSTPAAPARTVFYSATAYAPTERPPPVIEEASLTGVEAGAFRTSPWLDRPSDLIAVARYVGVAKPGIINGGGDKSAQIYDQVLLTYTDAGRPSPGAMLLLVRTGRSVGNWGRVIEPIAVLEVTNVSAELPTATIVEQFDQLEEGDIALPLAPLPTMPGQEPRPVENGPIAQVIDFAIEQPMYSVNDHLFLDIGRAQGIEVGDEFQIYLPGREVSADGGRLTPSQRIAIVRVVRTTERVATARVTELLHPVLEPGLPAQLIRGMGE